MGEFVKSASSTVEAPVARRLREVFVATPSAPAPAPAATVGRTKVTPAKPAPPKRTATKAVPTPPPAPVIKPASAHDIEVAAAEVRAAALKADQDAAVKAAQQAAKTRRAPQGDGAVVTPKPGPA